MEPIVFSFLIATKDRSRDLQRTLRSLERFLSRADVECLVCNDGSTDATAAVLQEFRKVTVIDHPQSRGYIASRNELLSRARGQYAISLDDDAEFLSHDPLEEIDRHFVQNPNCGAIGFRIFWGLEKPAETSSSDSSRQVKSFVGCGHAWRMDAWRAIRPYPEWFEFYGEEEFASLELFRKGQEVHYLPSVLVHHRVDMQARRESRDFSVRYRRSLRSGFYLQFLFYPGFKSWRHFAASIARQARNRILKNYRLAKPLAQALADLARNAPIVARHRTPLSAERYRQYRALPDPIIYWKPES